MGLVQYIGQLRDNEVGILNCIAEIPKRRQRRHPKLKAPRYCLNNKGLETKVVLPNRTPALHSKLCYLRGRILDI